MDIESVLNSEVGPIMELIRLRSEQTILPISKSNTNADQVALSTLIDPQFRLDSLTRHNVTVSGCSGKLLQLLGALVTNSAISSAHTLSVPTVRRHQKLEKLTPINTERLLGVCSIWSQLMHHFRDNHKLVNDWLLREKRPLAGMCPVSLMASEAGRKAVLDLIFRMETGDFS